MGEARGSRCHVSGGRIEALKGLIRPERSEASRVWGLRFRVYGESSISVSCIKYLPSGWEALVFLFPFVPTFLAFFVHSACPLVEYCAIAVANTITQ